MDHGAKPCLPARHFGPVRCIPSPDSPVNCISLVCSLVCCRVFPHSISHHGDMLCSCPFFFTLMSYIFSASYISSCSLQLCYSLSLWCEGHTGFVFSTLSLKWLSIITLFQVNLTKCSVCSWIKHSVKFSDDTALLTLLQMHMQDHGINDICRWIS